VPSNWNPSHHKKGRLSLRIQESKEMFGDEEPNFLCRGFLFRVKENNPEMECVLAYPFQIHLFQVTSAG
jgi:hypothetical protein